MNISPINSYNFRGNTRPSISDRYPNYHPNMKDDDVVTTASWGGDYVYPITAKQVREEIKKLEAIEKELEIAEAKQKEAAEKFKQWREENGNLSTAGANYSYYSK